MLPFVIDGDLPFSNGDYLYIKDIKKVIQNKDSDIKAYVVNKDMKEFSLSLGHRDEEKLY